VFIHCVKNHNFGFSLCYTLSIGEFNREEFLLPHVRTRNLVKRTQLKDVIWLQHHVASFSSSSSSSSSFIKSFLKFKTNHAEKRCNQNDQVHETKFVEISCQ